MSRSTQSPEPRSEVCAVCTQGTATETLGECSITVNGVSYTLTDDRQMQCDACGEVYYLDDQAQESMRRMVRLRQESEGLLTGTEIRELRQALGLSQSQLEVLLGVGKKTVVRWEQEKVVQSRAADGVLRLLRENPANALVLAQQREIEVPGLKGLSESQQRALRKAIKGMLETRLGDTVSRSHLRALVKDLAALYPRAA